MKTAFFADLMQCYRVRLLQTGPTCSRYPCMKKPEHEKPETGDYCQHSCCNLSTAYKLEPSRPLTVLQSLGSILNIPTNLLPQAGPRREHWSIRTRPYPHVSPPHALAPTCNAALTSAACWGHAEMWLWSAWIEERGGGLPAALIVVVFLCFELNSAAPVESLQIFTLSDWPTLWMCEECELKR